MQDEKTTHEVPRWGLATLEKKVAKLNKRANKIGCPEMTVKVVREWDDKEMVPGVSYHIDGAMDWSGRYIKMFEVELEGDAPKINGWQFLAAITHMPAGNIIRQTPVAIEEEIPVDKKYRDAASDCDHCKTHRKRHNTFIVKSEETGETKQVGSSCLVDFLGHSSPDLYLYHAKMLDEVEELFESGFAGGVDDFKQLDVSLSRYLQHVSQFILEDGFTSRGAAYENPELAATADLASYNMNPPSNLAKGSIKTVSDQAKELAKKTVAWGQKLSEQDNKNDYIHNLSVIFKSDNVSYKELGLAASAVYAYQKEITKEIKKELEKPVIPSEFFGEPKKREDFTLTLVSTKDWDSDYGTTFFHSFMDASGNVAVWFGSTPLLVVDEKGNNCYIEDGEKVRVKATVKEHSEYNDVKQTVLTRVKGLELIKE